MQGWYGNLSNWECRSEPLPYTRGSEEPPVAGSLGAVADIVFHIVVAVAGIVNTAVSIVELENTLSVEQAHRFCMIYDCRIGRRNLHLGYSACHS